MAQNSWHDIFWRVPSNIFQIRKLRPRQDQEGPTHTHIHTKSHSYQVMNLTLNLRIPHQADLTIMTRLTLPNLASTKRNTRSGNCRVVAILHPRGLPREKTSFTLWMSLELGFSIKLEAEVKAFLIWTTGREALNQMSIFSQPHRRQLDTCLYIY